LDEGGLTRNRESGVWSDDALGERKPEKYGSGDSGKPKARNGICLRFGANLPRLSAAPGAGGVVTVNACQINTQIMFYKRKKGFTLLFPSQSRRFLSHTLKRIAQSKTRFAHLTIVYSYQRLL
jgi:hypothetical protein